MAIALSVSAQKADQDVIDVLQERLEAIEADVARSGKFKISGYIQGQYQWGQEAASLKVGSDNESEDEAFSRVGIRRGRIKFVYEENIVSGVFQLDITENGVGIKDAYLNIKNPWFESMALRAGVFDRPFGFEIGYSSSRRESPERSAVFQTLFPQERDLGAMLILQAPESSPWSLLKLETGLFAGNGIKKEIDSKRDFIGHFSASKSMDRVSFGAGISYYNGKVYQGTEKVYTMDKNGFELDEKSANKGDYAKREYIGFEGRFSISGMLGLTQLRGEYIFGKQPGTKNSSKSPNSSSLPADDMYLRDFNGGYIMLIQDIGRFPFAVIGKYDWFDPNTKVSGNDTGQNGTTKTDLSQNTVGFGALWNINKSLRLQAFYEINKNEKTIHIEGWESDRKDDVFTLRLQCRF